MDRKTLIANLNKVFCDLSKNGRKYTCVWLEDEDFGGVYNSGKYVLNVQAAHEVEACSTEMAFIINHLAKVAQEELVEILRVSVYNSDMDVHCIMDINDALVYNEVETCK